MRNNVRGNYVIYRISCSPDLISFYSYEKQPNGNFELVVGSGEQDINQEN